MCRSQRMAYFWMSSPMSCHWKEPSAGVSLADQSGEARLPQPAVVDTVEPGSIGEELGFQPGDKLLSINGVRPRDLIDLQWLVGVE